MGTVLLLSGDLGAGKTAFVRGLAEGLGIDAGRGHEPDVHARARYRGGRLPLIHVDLYRLDRADLDEIGLDQDLAATGIVAVEWSERIVARIPGADGDITDRGGDSRDIESSTRSAIVVRRQASSAWAIASATRFHCAVSSPRRRRPALVSA